MENDRQPRRRGAVRRVARLCVWLVLGLELLYLGAANGFLHSRWGRQTLNRKPEKLAITWQRAWTWWPGIVHVRQLEIRGRARRADWSTSVDRGRLVILLPALVRRHFHLLGGRAHGLEIAVADRSPPETPRPAPRRRPWRVSLDDLDLQPLRIFRLNRYELAGAGRATGWAHFEVHGPVELELTSLAFADAVLLDGGEIAADALRFDGRLRIEPFVVGEDTVRDLLAGLTGEVELETEASSLGFLAAYLEGTPWLRLGGSGHLTARLEASNGWLAPGSRLDLAGPTVETELFGLHASGEGLLMGRVPESSSHTELTVELPSFAVTRIADQARLLEGEDLRVVVTNDSNAIDRPADGLALEVILPPTHVPDLAAYSVYLPEAAGLELTGGTAELEASLTYSAPEQTGDGWLRLAGRQVQAAFGEVRLQADVELDSRLSNARLEAGRMDIAEARLEIDQVRTGDRGRLRDSDWWGRIRLPGGRLQLAMQEPVAVASSLEAQVDAELRDTGPLVALLEQHVPRLAWMDGLLTVHNVQARSGVRIAGPRLSLSDLRVTGGRKGRLEILGQLDLARQDPTGLFFARWGKLSAAVSLEEGERGWKLTGSRRWYDAGAQAYRSRRQPVVAHP